MMPWRCVLRWARINDSVIIGTSTGSSCNASLACVAIKKGDTVGTACNSVLGTTYR